MKFMFKSTVFHNKQKFVKGNACPDEIVDAMKKLEVVEPVPEPVHVTEAKKPEAKK